MCHCVHAVVHELKKKKEKVLMKVNCSSLPAFPSPKVHHVQIILMALHSLPK